MTFITKLQEQQKHFITKNVQSQAERKKQKSLIKEWEGRLINLNIGVMSSSVNNIPTYGGPTSIVCAINPTTITSLISSINLFIFLIFFFFIFPLLP